LRRKPRVAAEQDELPPSVGLSKMRLDRRPILTRQMAKDFSDAAVLTGSRQLECAIYCRCHD
jgi:hypothetical protein